MPGRNAFSFVIAIVYGIAALRTIGRIWRYRAHLADNTVFDEFQRQTAYASAFFLCVPITVYLHELGHALTAHYYGAQDIRIHFYFYFGDTTYVAGLPPRCEWWIALAGNLVTFGLGLVSLAVGLLLPMRQFWRCIWLSLCAIELVQVLLWYPGLCLLGGYQGDFTVIYGKAYFWSGMYVVGVIHAAAAFLFLGAYYLPAWRRWWQPYFALRDRGGFLPDESAAAETSDTPAQRP